ncbi:hypothetical protein QVD17_18335 [Tagetes erecta]|uniref:Uncharacterized protein n=1 Tax=Tagetes erecta TaxID=13708 RepID=A0AAD8KKY5_TARER|nr:hypothetical protein QVD17_18335 [Tagetes erecta]
MVVAGGHGCCVDGVRKLKWRDVGCLVAVVFDNGTSTIRVVVLASEDEEDDIDGGLMIPQSTFTNIYTPYAQIIYAT